MKGLTLEQLEFLAAKGLSLEDAITFSKMGATKSKAAERTARWRARKAGNVTGDVTRDASPPPIDNHTPPVSSDEETKPVAKSKRKIAAIPAAKPDDVKAEVWRDFTGQRKTPFTETALDGVRQESASAGWTLNAALTEAVARGWQSFKAEWVRGATGPPGRQAEQTSYLDHLVEKSRRQSEVHAHPVT